MRGVITKVNRLGKYIEVSFPSFSLKYYTEDKNLLSNAKKEDSFFVKKGREQDGRLYCSTPPLIQPRKEALDYYLKKGKIKTYGTESWEELVKFSTSLLSEDKFRAAALNWWKKNIVFRSFRLISLSLHDARKIADLQGATNLEGVYEKVLEQPLVYPFLSIELCDKILSYHAKKIPSFMLPVLRLTRDIYKKLENGWVYTPEREIKRLLHCYSEYLPVLEELNISVENNCFYYRAVLEAEKKLVKKLLQLRETKVEKIEAHLESDLSSEQKEALKLCLDNPVVIVEGYAGTGKTTLIAELVRYLPNAVVLSFTGKAVSRLRKVVNETCCLTIHKLIYSDYVPSEIIIDEASMVSLPLFSALISRYPLKRIILVGDPFQLPPIEYGRVFERLISSKKFPSSKLSKIFRTTENLILENSFNLREGKLEEFSTGDSFQLISGEIPQVFQLVQSLYPEMVTIITPYVRFLRDLNKGCQDIYHRGKPFHLDIYNNRYFIGDRVMCTENDYDKDVFNGEEGVVIEVRAKKLRVQFASGIKEYDMEEEEDMAKISLAYAMSVHKAQGSEYPLVLFFLEKRPNGHSSFLNQRMIYTAITRAKEKLYFIGSSLELEEGCQRVLPFTYDNIVKRLSAS